jgi:NitT/TauT family transport system substrate-binding protein
VPLRRSVPVVALVALLALAGCGTGSATFVPTPPGTTTLTVGLGYIPNVQFAPFYLAQQNGYYRDAGLAVTFQNKIDPDLVTLVGQGTLDIGLADGTSVIPAVSQSIPIRYVATVYRQFPSIVFAKQTSGIAKAADLKGRKIGIPGRYGSSWIMLQALLGSAGLKPEDVTITEYPDFGQGAAVQQGAVDAATGFVNNEPIQLEQAGSKANVLHVDDIVPLPGPGLIVGTGVMEAKRAGISAFIAATLRAMREIAADPEVGLKATAAAVPDLAGSHDLQAAVLNATIAAWKGDGDPGSFGAIDKSAWTKSIEYMTKLGLVPNQVSDENTVDDSFLPKS